MKRPLHPALLLAGWLLLLAHPHGMAQGISGIASDNRSTPNSSVSSSHDAAEFGSELSFRPAVLEGNVASFTHRMAWFGGVMSEPYAFATTVNTIPELDYRVTFTVEDPFDQGYTLRVQSELRGVLLAAAAGTSFASAELTRFKVSALAAFEPHSIELPDLTTPRTTADAGGLQVRSELDVDHLARSTVGHWVGTRSFLLTVDGERFAVFSSILDLLASPGLAFTQFGLAPGAPQLQFGAYTGAGAPPITELGHFLNVQAVYDIPAVPEPASLLLWAGGGVALWLRRRRCAGPDA